MRRRQKAAAHFFFFLSSTPPQNWVAYPCGFCKGGTGTNSPTVLLTLFFVAPRRIVIPKRRTHSTPNLVVLCTTTGNLSFRAEQADAFSFQSRSCGIVGLRSRGTSLRWIAEPLQSRIPASLLSPSTDTPSKKNKPSSPSPPQSPTPESKPAATAAHSAHSHTRPTPPQASSPPPAATK